MTAGSQPLRCPSMTPRGTSPRHRSTVLDAAEPLLAGTCARRKVFHANPVRRARSLWQQFSTAVGARSKRKALAQEWPNDVRDVEAQFSLCDDFLLQFAMSGDEGLQFSDAWFAARQVIDLGCRAAKPNAATPPNS